MPPSLSVVPPGVWDRAPNPDSFWPQVRAGSVWFQRFRRRLLGQLSRPGDGSIMTAEHRLRASNAQAWIKEIGIDSLAGWRRRSTLAASRMIAGLLLNVAQMGPTLELP
jgi:hypothetical protein